MQINSYNNHQNFGMALKANKRALNALELRLKPEEWGKLSEIIEEQKENPVHIMLDNFDAKGKLSAQISDGELISKQANESGFLGFLSSPLKFIRQQAEKANKLREIKEEVQPVKDKVLEELT